MRDKDNQFSTIGVLVGTFFFAFSLTPSLLPRNDLMQGVISGLSLTAGYAVGVFVRWLWVYLELPMPRPRIQWYIKFFSAAVCTVVAAVFLWQATGWQNSIRSIMGMEETAGMRPLVVGAVALLLFIVLLLVSRLFSRLFLFLSRRLQHFIPRKVSQVLGLLGAIFLFWSVVNGFIFKIALRAADRSYQQLDALLDPAIEKPTSPFKTGSTDSLIDWIDLGRQGRIFVSSGPTAVELRAVTPKPVLDPLRVYVGLNSAENPQARARLALQELIRVNAFARSVLVLITPTGTGWVDAGAIDTVEVLHRGDIASVAVQYSYLSSPLTLLFEPEYGAETARAVFDAVYGYWTKLPHDKRPALYLHGLSLGSMNSDVSFDVYDIIEDPFQGALWSGPPFRSETWQAMTARRDPGSPEWLPRFRGGAVVRFANQETGLKAGNAKWGAFRIAFLQYASDPITFFAPGTFYRKPDWMNEPRGPDVSPDLRWFPIVTGLQLLADMATGSAPVGFGHEFAPEHYFDAWLALTEPAGWSDSELARLRALFEDN
ncbi:MAG: alpha/beta-hydrolase family protein [Desulfobacterales bacterium]